MSARQRLLAALTLSSAVALAFAPVPVLAGAASAAGSPAALVQDGRDLVWSVKLGAPFSPAALQRQGRTLCVTINREHSQRLCVIGPRRGGRAPQVTRQTIVRGQPGPARAITAGVTRASSAEITVRLPGLAATLAPAAAALAPAVVRWRVSGPVTFPAQGSARLSVHVPIPSGCVASGPDEVFSGPPRREIALTFDDGPWGTPPAADFLSMLERAHAVATFFEIGRQIAGYDPGGRLERRMLADGDFIGNHTWSHPVMTGLSTYAQEQQLTSTEQAISSATVGFHTCLFRPPYGAANSALVATASRLGFVTIQWDVDPADWSTPGTATIYQRVVSHAHDGAIVLQHFGGGPRYETLAAVPQEIATLRARGYRFVTIPQLLGLRVTYR